MSGLEIEGIHVRVNGELVLRGVTLRVPRSSVVVLMGPNGSGKSTLAYAVMGHPRYRVERGRILLDGDDVTGLKPEERALKGLFLAFQSPPTVESVKVGTLIREALARRGFPFSEAEVIALLERVGLNRSYLLRGVHDGFSGGERKRMELAQALALKPRFIVMDEPDSGLDVEGVKLLASEVAGLAESGAAVLVITHNPRTAEILAPDKVAVLVSGRIAAEGGLELAREIGERGYEVVAG